MTLVAVSKGHGAAALASAVACGQTVFGESRVQEAAAKVPLTPAGARWHMVGHLQRNKADVAVGLFELIHSVDSARLVRALDVAWHQRTAAVGVLEPVRVLLQVNISGEAAKFGVSAEGASALLDAALSARGIRVMGLMTIPPIGQSPGDARPFFRQLHDLRDELEATHAVRLPELSMGMSSDFEVAIEEGATLVRVGTAIFGQRERSPEAVNHDRSHFLTKLEGILS